MAKIEPIRLLENMRELGWQQQSPVTAIAKRTLTSDSTIAQLGGGYPGAIGGFAAARVSRLTADWSIASRSIDQDLQVGLRTVRARARNQAFNSPIAAKFLGMVRNNVVGHHGVKLAFKVAQQRKSRKGNGLDDDANEELARAWREWGKKGNCTVCGRYSWRGLQRLIIENTARDGEQFLRKVYVPRTVSPFGFMLQLIDADQVDDSLNNLNMPGGVQIRMGVEVDANQKPIAYHIFDGNPYESGYGASNRKRVPADQILHFFIPHRTGQTRGYPWFAASMDQLNMLDGYFKAELTAARISSSVVMSIETDPNAPAEEFDGNGINSDGTKAIDLGSGTALEMPQGQHLNDHTPSHPTQAFESFVKQSGREIASGMSVAYHKLCNDLNGVNYSSGRLGELEERDFWMEMQAHLIDDVLEPIYDTWLPAGLLWGAIDLPSTDKKRFSGDAIKWEPRRWPWVDPLKDVQASTLLVQNGFETNESILNSQGRDLEEVYNQRKREQDLADELGLKFGTDIRGQGTSEVNAGADTVEDSENTDGEEKPEKPAAQAAEKPKKPKAATKPAPAKPKGRELERGMHPANAAIWDLTKDEE